MNAIVKIAKGKALATKGGGAIVKLGKGRALAKGAGNAGLMLMNQTVEQFAPALRVAQRYRPHWESAIGPIGIVGVPRNVDVAKQIHQSFLAALPVMDATCSTLERVQRANERMDRASAMLMLNVLFAAIGKRKSDDENATLLAAAADMFNPANDVLANIKLASQSDDSPWVRKPIYQHPLVLAIAVKKLIETAKFTSCAELREAMADVSNSIGVKIWHLGYMTQRIDDADEMLFERDRASWDQMHARVDAAVERTMLRELLSEEGPSNDTDENGNPEFPPSPRWLALEEMLKAKEASKQREAACRTTPAKRTRKAKAKAEGG
jgi:hypothetical protein